MVLNMKFFFYAKKEFSGRNSNLRYSGIRLSFLMILCLQNCITFFIAGKICEVVKYLQENYTCYFVNASNFPELCTFFSKATSETICRRPSVVATAEHLMKNVGKQERRDVKKNEPRYSVYNSFILKDFNFEKVRLSKYKRVCRQNMFLDKYKRAQHFWKIISTPIQVQE